jgi:hypothetical protein
MGHTKLARELAEQTGSNIRRAATFVDDVGPKQARRLLDTAEDSIPLKVPATAGIGTAGVLAFRQQDVEKAQAEAREAESEQLAARDLIEDSSLTPEQKGELLDQLVGDGSPGPDDDNSEDSGFSPFDDLSELFAGDGLQGTIVRVIVLLIIILIVTNYASETLLPMPDADVNIGGDS